LKSSPKHKIEISKDNPHATSLTVSKLDASDTGTYTAIIDNGLEKIECHSALTVHAKPKLESKLEANMTFNIGEQGEIPIRISGENNIVTWFKDSQPINFDDRIRLITDETNSYRLVIDDLRSEDKGIYSMHIENKGGVMDLKTTLNVKEQKPQLLADLKDTPAANTAKIGEEFVLEIHAQGKPRPQITWLFNGQELPIDAIDYHVVVTDDGLCRLVFDKFDERFIGEYQAVINNSAGTIKTKKVKVTGQQIPMFTQEPPEAVQVKTGEKLTVECMAKGQPAPKISWLRDGKVLSNKDGFDIKIDQVTGQASFTITNATMKHKGKYECKIENQYGTHTAEIDVDVLGKIERNILDDQRLSLSMKFVLAPPAVQQKMQDFETARGQEVAITVTADGSPLPTCTWYRNDQPIQIEENRVMIIDDGATHTLKLLDVQLSDDGQYKVKYNRFCFNSFHDHYLFLFAMLRPLLKIKWEKQNCSVKSLY
jgi:hemicentin